MIIKDNRLSAKEDWYIKPLDIIRIPVDICSDEADDSYMVVRVEGDKVQMVSLLDGFMYDHETFNHPIHLHNHLLKHYGEYELVKNKDLAIEINGPVRTIKKGMMR